MKIVKLELSESARRELLNLQNNGSGLMRERSLAILHCANGQKITWIANALNRRILTIRTWIERYRKDGIRGLERSYSLNDSYLDRAISQGWHPRTRAQLFPWTSEWSKHNFPP